MGEEHKEVDRSKLPASFYRFSKGFLERRVKDLQRQQERLMEQQAKEEAKRRKELELKNDFLDPTNYIEQFKLTRDIVDYALKRVTLQIANALNKVKLLQKRISDGEVIENLNDELPIITLTSWEVSQISMYKNLFETTRTAMKLPIRYNAVFDEDQSRESIGDLLRAISDYQRQGGVLVDEEGQNIPQLDVKFDRSKVKL